MKKKLKERHDELLKVLAPLKFIGTKGADLLFHDGLQRSFQVAHIDLSTLIVDIFNLGVRQGRRDILRSMNDLLIEAENDLRSLDERAQQLRGGSS